MHYHKSPKNRRVLALLLTGSFSEEFPFMPASTAMLNYQPKTMVLI